MRLVVGVGNPGRDYEGTRHNVGFLVVQRLAERLSVSLDTEKMPGLGKTFGRLGRVRDMQGDVRGLLLEPWTFVNLSGGAVAAAMRRYDIQVADLLVVTDDHQLPLGKLRIRGTGSSGGHNGLRSIESSLGTRDYARLRVGIGEPRGDSARYVLSRFSKAEREEVALAVERSADAGRSWLDGVRLEDLMNEYNRREANP